MSRDVIGIYLRDHAAVSAAGVSLARRAAAGNEGSEFGHCASSLAAELERHDAALMTVMRALGVRSGRVKRGGARLAERAGRLKLNGRLTSKSPLSPVVEAEGLLAILAAHLLVWQALRGLRGVAVPVQIDPAALAESARDRIEELEAHRLRLLQAAID